MSLIPWRQKREEQPGEGTADSSLTRFRGEMDSLFERFFGDACGTSLFESLPARFGWGPRLDVAESEDHITVRAELPGVQPEDVTVEVQGNSLSIRGEKKADREEQHENYHFVERQYGTFHRTVQLPISVDPNNVNASFKNGVLTVTMAKSPESKAKRIDVQAG